MQLTLNAVTSSKNKKIMVYICRTNPANPVPFIFDESLVDDTSGKLLANKLTVDNLTVEWLKNKQSELETSIKEKQEKQALILPANNDGLVNGKTGQDTINSRLVLVLVHTFMQAGNLLFLLLWISGFLTCRNSYNLQIKYEYKV